MRATPKKEIIKKIVVDTAIDEETVSDVISYAFSRAMKAFKTGNSVEISGFGKFMFNEYSLQKNISTAYRYLEKMKMTREKNMHLPKYVEYMDMLIRAKKEVIKDLERRQNDKLESCDRGVEKSPSSSGEPESSN